MHFPWVPLEVPSTEHRDLQDLKPFQSPIVSIRKHLEEWLTVRRSSSLKHLPLKVVQHPPELIDLSEYSDLLNLLRIIDCVSSSLTMSYMFHCTVP